MSFFELCQAKNWALAHLKSHNVSASLDVRNISEPAWKWFLQDIPQYYGGVRLEEWHCIDSGNCLVYSKTSSDINVRIHVIQCRVFTNTKYVGLYKEDGTRYCDAC